MSNSGGLGKAWLKQGCQGTERGSRINSDERKQADNES